jgi:uncharacterized Rossmann fold enzyme
MPVAPLHPELEDALTVGIRPMPADPAAQFAMEDRPFMFGDDPTDSIQGVLNIARNAQTILRAPRLPRCDNVPAIAVGSGPSVLRHLDTLRALQSKCLIVSAQTAAKGLLEAGITPHLITPMERPRSMADYLPIGCSAIAFAGAPLVHPDVLNRFSRHFYVPSGDVLYKWTNLPGEDRVFYGSSTGTTAINVAAYCTKRKVYLVGHDLAYDGDDSHFPGSQAVRTNRAKARDTIEGHNGEQLPCERIWKRLCGQIADTANSLHSGLVNVNAHYRTGAMIPGLPGEPLPDPATLQDFNMPAGEPQPDRLRNWRGWASKLPMHARQLDRFFQNATDVSPEQTDIMRAGIGQNAHVMSYLLVSVMVQMSYELRMRWLPPDKVLQWFKSATHNVLHSSRGFYEQIADHAEACTP